MILEKSLEQFGLTDKEARVYLAVLELGQDTVLNIAKKAELKRPTVYLILDSLISKGLISILPKAGKTLYLAENPDYLLTVLEKRKEGLKNILPMLSAMYRIEKQKPQVRYYEGKEGVKRIYSELRQAKEYILFYGSIKDISKDFEEELLIPEEIKKMGIQVKEIMTSDPIDLKYAKRIMRMNNPNHIVRIVKKGVDFALDSAIFDDKIAIVSVKKDFFGVIIESKDISHSFKVLYELAWQAAKEVK